jgi:hypothetical protein
LELQQTVPVNCSRVQQPHLNDEVNKENYHYWVTENSYELYMQPLHSSRVTVWCAVFPFSIHGPLFFRNKEVVTITADHYRKMTDDFCA